MNATITTLAKPMSKSAPHIVLFLGISGIELVISKKASINVKINNIILLTM